jgi:long-chain fatty acid transport protein
LARELQRRARFQRSWEAPAVHPVWLVAASGFLVAADACAVGFALEQQSGSSAGYAFAGSAGAEDASAMFGNPAALGQLRGTEVSGALHAIYGDARFTDEGTLSPAGPGFPITGGTGGNPVGWNVIPNLYFATDINPTVRFGLGVNSPFGLRTEYPSDWIGRYQAVDSVLKTVNINPAIAWKVSRTLSIGAGVNAQYFDARISNAIDYGTACFGVFGPGACTGAGILPQMRDGSAEIRGDSWGFGWNVGALIDVTPELRLGVSYRSRIRHEVKADATFTNPALPVPFSALALQNTGARSTITVPDSATVGMSLKLDDMITVVSDVTWTGWNKFNELRVRFDNGTPDAVTPANWRNTMRYAVGVGYQMNPRVKLRFGVAYEESAIPDEFRTARIPDNDHTIVALGANYKFTKASSIDLAYHHGFVKRAPINTSVTGAGTLTGNSKVSADVISVQYNHGF